jgi:hypothetical protein
LCSGRITSHGRTVATRYRPYADKRGYIGRVPDFGPILAKHGCYDWCMASKTLENSEGTSRQVVVWSMPPTAGALIGRPCWSGLAALVGADRRSDVWVLLLRRTLSIPTSAREQSR